MIEQFGFFFFRSDFVIVFKKIDGAASFFVDFDLSHSAVFAKEVHIGSRFQKIFSRMKSFYCQDQVLLRIQEEKGRNCFDGVFFHQFRTVSFFSVLLVINEMTIEIIPHFLPGKDFFGHFFTGTAPGGVYIHEQ